MVASTQELLELLTAYTRGELDADQSSEIQALITSYIDGLLDAETEGAMDRAIEANPVLGEEVEKARRGKDILAELFPPTTEPLEDPDSPEIQQYIDDIIAKAERSKAEPEEAKVVPLPIARPERSRTWYALAASIAIALIGGASWIALTFQDRFEQSRVAQAELQEEIEQLGAELLAQRYEIASLDEQREVLTSDLASAQAARDAAATERAALEEQMAGLRSDLDSSNDQLQAVENERIRLASDVERLAADLGQTEADRDDAQSALTEAEEQLATLQSDISRLTADLAQLDEARQTATTELTDAENTIVSLRDQQQSLEQRIAGLETEAAASDEQREAIEAERDLLTADITMLQETLTSVEAERDDAKLALTEAESQRASLEEGLIRVNTELAAATSARETAETQLAETDEAMEALRAERTDLENQIADLALQAEARTGLLEERRQRLATLEDELATVQTNWEEAQQQIVQQAIARTELDTKVASLENRLKWTSQVAQYHARFAQQPRRRWVEAGINEPERLDTLLADIGNQLGLNRPLPLPESLASQETGLTFMGARQLVINGMTVAQLVYKDEDDELLAFCVMRNMSGQNKDLTQSTFGPDLRLVDWRDQEFQYVIVGYEPSNRVREIAAVIRQSYDPAI